MYTTSLLLLWIVFIVVEVYRNYTVIVHQGRRPNYLISFVIRGMASIVHGILFDVEDMRDFMPLLLFQCSSFLIIFNPTLNILRKLDFWYVGRNSGWLDKAFYEDRGLYLLTYFGCLSVCITSILVIYYKFGG